MRVIRLSAFQISVIDADNMLESLKNAIGGKPQQIPLYDGAVMIIDRDALARNKPYNNLASLIARNGVYGDAIIAGDDDYKFCDVPDKFLALLDYPEFYFRDE